LTIYNIEELRVSRKEMKMKRLPNDSLYENIIDYLFFSAKFISEPDPDIAVFVGYV